VSFLKMPVLAGAGLTATAAEAAAGFAAPPKRDRWIVFAMSYDAADLNIDDSNCT